MILEHAGRALLLLLGAGLAFLPAGLPPAAAQTSERTLTLVFMNAQLAGSVEIAGAPDIESGTVRAGNPNILPAPLQPFLPVQVTFASSSAEDPAIAGSAEFTTFDGVKTITWSWPQSAAEPSVTGFADGGSPPDIRRMALEADSARYMVEFR